MSGAIQRTALYLLFFLLNFEDWVLGGGGDPVSLAKVAGWAYGLSVARDLPRYLKRGRTAWFMMPLWFLFALVVIQNIFHAPASPAFWINFSWLQNVVLVWLLLNHVEKDPVVLDRAIRVFALGAAVAAGLFAAGIGVEPDADGRAQLFGDNSNAIAIRQVVGITVIGWMVMNWTTVGIARYILLLPLPLMVTLIAESGSRKALIALTLVTIGMALAYRGTNWWKRIMVVGAVAVSGVMGWQSLAESETLMRRMNDTIETRSLGIRGEIWALLLPLVGNSPLLGIGEAGYQQVVDAEFRVEAMSPHNVLLEVTIYSGVVGLWFFLWFLWRVGKAAIHAAWRERNLLPLLLLVPVSTLVTGGQMLTVKLAWSLLTYAAAQRQRSLGEVSRPLGEQRPRHALRPESGPKPQLRPDALGPA